MAIITGWLIIIISCLVHEIAHGIAMHKKGIAIKEIGFGIPWDKIPSISFRIKKYWPDITIRLNVLLLIAYIKTDDEKDKMIEKMPYKDYSVIYGSGPLSNFLLGLLFYGALVLYFDYHWLVYLIITFIGCWCWVLKDKIMVFLLPLLSIACFVFITRMVIFDPTKSLGGPVTICILAYEIIGGRESVIEGILNFGFGMNISLAIVNLLPIVKIDAGQVFGIMSKKCNKSVYEAYKYTSWVYFCCIIVIALYNDWNKFTSFF
ncbi:site-2 protease family protein [Patescibacteria group bacterium]